MFDGMFSRIFQDLLSKGLQIAGAVIAGSGVATGEQSSAIMGGVAALVGVLWNLWSNAKDRKDVTIVAAAVDNKTSTATVVKNNFNLRPVGHDK